MAGEALNELLPQSVAEVVVTGQRRQYAQLAPPLFARPPVWVEQLPEVLRGLVDENGRIFGPERGLPPSLIRPPTKGPFRAGPASRPSEVNRGGKSLYDPQGGEWRWLPGDRYHNPHWDYRPGGSPNIPWQNVPWEGVPIA